MPGTNADLTGVPLADLFPLIGGLPDTIIDPLSNGSFRLFAEAGVAETLGILGRPFGETAQLFLFSDGQPLGVSVTANLLGQPLQRVPLPPSLLLLAAGALGLAVAARRRR